VGVKRCISALAALVLCSSGPALGEIDSNTRFTLDLTNAKEAAQKATWSTPDLITVTAEGLGWGKPRDRGSRDVWLQTKPIGIGLSWRPTSIASIKATVGHPGISGLLYARYSADGKHWTSWQHLAQSAPGAAHAAPPSFEGTLRVPYRDQARYQELRLEYARRQDVPWPSDEEALVKDLVKRDPKFFEKSTPFIGYVQLLYETQLRGGQRIKSLTVDVGWWLGGKHIPPKNDKARQGRDVPWRFQAR
jgi:hypothetical protein